MDKVFYSLFCRMVCAAAVLAPGVESSAAEYRIDPVHSFVQFRTQHLGYSWLIGRFNTVSGKFFYDPSAAAAAQSIEVCVRAADIDSNHAERDKHLRGEDFFGTDEFAAACFRSVRFEGDENGGVMRGDLTLRGVTLPLSATVKKIGEGEDPWGGYRAGFEAAFDIQRSKFGVDKDLGPSSETVFLKVFIEGVRI